LLARIQDLCQKNELDFKDIQGIVGFKGPGSFTGLRIGLSVANALAYGMQIPIVDAKGSNWQRSGIAKLLSGYSQKIILPEYNSEPNITKPRK
jgi:tRNA threonylcarbamoyladenosine biosynthesis protein TsaB